LKQENSSELMVDSMTKDLGFSSRSFFRFWCVFLLVLCSHAQGVAGAGQAVADSKAPQHMLCDGLENPMGLGDRQPQLTWQLPQAGQDVRQTAYRLLVATKASLLVPGKADVWDSGKASSAESVNVGYDGPALQSSHRYYWAVRVWEHGGHATPFSRPAWWEMGLLRPSDWSAQWIAYDPREFRDDRASDPVWIGPGLGADPSTGAAEYRYSFDVAGTPRKAELFITGRETLKAWVNDESVSLATTAQHAATSRWGTFQQMDVTRQVKSGENVLAAEVNIHPHAGQPPALIAMLRITMADGTVRRVITSSAWKSTTVTGGNWQGAGYDDAAWQSAAVVAKMGQDGYTIPWPDQPAGLLRKEFMLAKPVASARLYVTALGSYEFHINGQRVGEQILAPGWTDYEKRIVYQDYDVTAMLHPGANAMGALLGEGWYATTLAFAGKRYNFGPPPPRILVQLEVSYRDGSQDRFVSDGSWVTAESAVLRSSIYDGEDFDARMEQRGWDKPGFDATVWHPARVEATNGAPLVAQDFQPIRVERTLHPRTVTEQSPGVYLFDLGQNMVGWARLRVSGPRGTKVSMRFGEVLDANGKFYNLNMRTAREEDTYILRGDGTETYEPHFTYHGFRYVEVTGYPGVPAKDAITGMVFHTDAPRSIAFRSGSSEVNRLDKNILWGQRGNFESVPTDCPQRDERLGWMGDANVFWRTASYNANLQAFTHKFTADIRDAQSTAGVYADVSPRMTIVGEGSPGWADAGVILPWTAYIQYRDKRVIRDNWDAMQHYMQHLEATYPDHLWTNKAYGDWLAIGSHTPRTLIGTAFWAYDATLMAQMADALGKRDDAAHFRALFAQLRDAFNRAFVQPDGTVGSGSQTSYVLALHMNLLPAALRPVAAEKLVADIHAHNNHLTTGFLGTPYLLLELSREGHSDVAYQLLLQNTFPSWLYMVRNGATTMWERWNGNQMLGDASMNSFNHYAYGAVGAWLYRYAAGIDEDTADPGFHHIVLHPQFSTQLGEASATYDSPYGPISSSWKASDSQVTWAVTIPANTRASLVFPANRKILINGKTIQSQRRFIAERRAARSVVYGIGSGSYAFAIGGEQ
jgi:alpha-L-rhamnosidase